MNLSEATFIAIGVLFVIAGVAILVRTRQGTSERRFQLPGLGAISDATAVTAAFVLLFLGYHTAAYGGPEGLLHFRVPPRLGWLVYVGGVLAVVGALLADRLEREE